MCIPIFFVCGEQESTKPLGQARFCANCGTKVRGGDQRGPRRAARCACLPAAAAILPAPPPCFHAGRRRAVRDARPVPSVLHPSVPHRGCPAVPPLPRLQGNVPGLSRQPRQRARCRIDGPAILPAAAAPRPCTDHSGRCGHARDTTASADQRPGSLQPGSRKRPLARIRVHSRARQPPRPPLPLPPPPLPPSTAALAATAHAARHRCHCCHRPCRIPPLPPHSCIACRVLQTPSANWRTEQLLVKWDGGEAERRGWNG